ncbi:MAG TPA: FkbM family methyltransferase [Longimicrobiales bacterium]|nr:FkbM family methyltransferase [Longimicrobiales bacterium]
MRWQLTRAYARAYGAVKDATGVNLRGLGWMLRHVRKEHEFELAEQRMLFHPAVGGCYDRLIAGQFNERETYQFIVRAIAMAAAPVTFVEVGANVGEFLIPLAAQPKVKHAIGYEPHPVCAAVCQRSALMNGLSNVEVRSHLVGDGMLQPFHINTANPNASAIDPNGELIPTVRLDDELRDVAAPLIMLIDVEGAEPLVFDGARETVKRTTPLIVFEYNYISRRHYSLAKVQGMLGSRYRIYRLRRDGSLDDKVEKSWNCVAVPKDSEFQALA